METKFDWFDLVINNPTKTMEDFSINGVTGNNTKFEDKEYYRDNPLVQEAFLNPETGKFDEAKFNSAYDNSAKLFNTYIQNEDNQRQLTSQEDIINYYSKKNLALLGRTSIRKVSNPTKAGVGLSSINKESKGLFSYREAAQNSQVKDWKTGRNLGWTPNDDDKRGLIDFWFTEPIVEARWEEDGTHIDPLTKQEVRHNKGDWKLNEDGNPYYETLGDRNISGLNPLHWEDTLTVDGTTWNKFDPFDSDGVSKSIGGQIMKTALYIAPYLIPGSREVVGAITAAKLLSEALSTFGKAGIEAFDSDYENNSLWKSLNSASGYLSRFDRSTSDEGSESMLNFEQATNMITDVVSQLYQQRMIAQIPSLLKWDKNNTAQLKAFINANGDKYLKQYGKTFQQAIKDGDISAKNLLDQNQLLSAYNSVNKLNTRAADLSKLYMVLTQTEGVYDTFKENNFNEISSAIGMLGTAYGFHLLFKTSLGDLALSGLGLDELGGTVRATTKAMAKDMKQSLDDIATKVTEESTSSQAPNKLAKVLSKIKIKEYGQKFSDKFKEILANKNIGSSMLKESLEEFSEEVNQDIMASSAALLEDALEKLNIADKTNTYDYFKTNPLERYLTSAIGGAIGGGIFKFMEGYENFLKNGTFALNQLPEDDVRNLVTVLINNPLSKVEDIIRKDIEAGKFGSTILSATPIYDSKGNISYGKAKDSKDSQNYVIGNNILGVVRAINSIIKAEVPTTNKNQIIDSAVNRQIMGNVLLSDSGKLNIIGKDFVNTVTRLVKAKSKLDGYKDGETPSQSDQMAYNDAKQDLEDLLSGKRSAEYAERLAFNLSRTINKPYMTPDIFTFSAARGKDYNSLSETDKAEMDKYFKEATTDDQVEEQAFKTFKFITNIIDPDLNKLSTEFTNNPGLSQFSKAIKELTEKINLDFENRYLDKDLIEAERSRLLAEVRDDDSYIRENGVNPEGVNLTEDVKKELVNKILDYKLTKFKDNLIAKRRLELLNPGTGFNSNIIGLDDIALREYASKVMELAKQANYIDIPTYNSVKNLFDQYNKFDINAIVPNILDVLKQKIQNGDKIIVPYELYDPNYKTYPDYDPEGKLIIYKNSDGYILADFESPSVSPEGLEDTINDKFLLDLITNNISFNYYDSSKIFGGIFEDNGQLNTKSDSANSIDEVIEDIVGTNYKKPGLEDLNNALIQLKSKAVYNPVQDMLSRLSVRLLGEDVFALLSKENQKVEGLNNILDYTLNDTITEGQFNNMLDLLPLVYSAIASRVRVNNDELSAFDNFSMLDFINSNRKQSGLNPYFGINEEDVKLINYSLNNLSDDLTTLLEFSANNTLTKDTESKATLIQNEINFLYLIGNTNLSKQRFSINGSGLTYGDQNLLFFDFPISEELASKINTIRKKAPREITEEDITIVDKALSEAQHYYYNKFNKDLSDDERTEILRKLASERGENENEQGLNWRENIETRLTRNTGVDDIGAETLAYYITSMLSVDQNIVKKKFLDVIKANPKYVPFFGQYLSIAMAYSNIIEPKYINQLEDLVKEYNPTFSNQVVTHNTTIISGDPGCGKTSAVSFFIDKMLEGNYDITIGAPISIQADKFAKNLDKPKGLVREEVMKKFLTNEGMKYYEDLMKAVSSGNEEMIKNYLINQRDSNQIKEPDSKYFNNFDKPQILFLDEFTHFSNFEIQLLSKVPNLKIILLGDFNQDKIKFPGGSIGGVVYTAPNIEMSVRANNGYTQEGLEVISRMVKTIRRKDNNSAFSGKIISTKNDYKFLKNEVYLKYYQDRYTLQGFKTTSSVNKDTIEDLVSKLEDGEKFCLITDKENSEYQNMFLELKDKYGDKIIIDTPDEVQGAEFKYVLLDVTYKDLPDVLNESEFTGQFKQLAQSFFTHISRASNGVIIIDKDNNLPIRGSKSAKFQSNSTIKSDNLDKFRENIIKAFSNSIGEKYEAPKNEVNKENKEKKDTEKLKQIEKDIQSSKKEIEKKDKKDNFKSKNTRLSIRSNHIGLRRDGDTYSVNSDSNEDLNVLLDSNINYTRDNIIGSSSYKGWRLLRKYLLSSAEEKRDLQSNLSKLYDFDGYLSLLTENSSWGTFEEAINKGGYYIKVTEDNQVTDYNFDSPLYNRGTRNYARLIYKVPDINGREIEITLADLTISDDIKDSKLKAILEQDYRGNAGYYKVKNINGIQFRDFETFTYKLDEQGNKVTDKNGAQVYQENEYGVPLSEFNKEFPELNISSIYYDNSGTLKSGSPYVLISDDSRLNSDELLIDNYTAEDPYKVQKVWVNEPFIFPEEFFTRVSELFSKRHEKAENFYQLLRYSPMITPINILKACRELYKTLSDNPDKIKEYNEGIEVYDFKAENFNEKSKANKGVKRVWEKEEIPITQDFIQALANLISGAKGAKGTKFKIDNFGITFESLSDFESYYKELFKSLGVTGEPLNTYLPKFDPSELAFIKKIGIGRSIQSVFATLQNENAAEYVGANLQKIGDESGASILAKKIQQYIEAFKNVNSLILEKKTEDLLDSISSGIIFYSFQALPMLQYFTQQWENDSFKPVIRRALEYSNTFKNGILISPRDTSAELYRGHIKSLTSKDEAYFQYPIRSRYAYINNDVIELEQVPESKQEENKVDRLNKNIEEIKQEIKNSLNTFSTDFENANDDFSNDLKEFYENVDKELNEIEIDSNLSDSDFNSALSEELNSLSKKYDKLTWNNGIKLITLEFENNRLIPKLLDETRIKEDIRNSNNCSDIINNLSDSNNLKFVSLNNKPYIQTSDGRYFLVEYSNKRNDYSITEDPTINNSNNSTTNKVEQDNTNQFEIPTEDRIKSMFQKMKITSYSNDLIPNIQNAVKKGGTKKEIIDRIFEIIKKAKPDARPNYKNVIGSYLTNTTNLKC